MSHAPPSTTQRIAGFDIARAFAVLGMVLVNFKVVMGAGESGAPWLQAVCGFFDGKAAATFVVLAGVGISLLSRRGVDEGGEQLSRARRRIWKRALFLFVVGLAYTPVWPGDILHFYGVYLALAAFVIAWPPRILMATGLVMPVVFLLLVFGLDYEAGWNWETLVYSGFWTPEGMLRHLFFNGFHPVVPWIGFLLVGMWLGRRDLGEAGFRRRVLALGVGLLVATRAGSALLLHEYGGMFPDDEAQALLGTGPMPPMPLYFLAGLGAAFTVIAASCWLEERFAGSAPVRALVAAGQLALTLYVAHVIVGMGVLEALGRLENQTLAFAAGAAIVFTLLGVLFAWAWRRRFARGPLEILMRAVTG